MNERERLLRAIEAAPKDDTVRLVFADWLEEHDELDRARFIRLQCEHGRLYPRTARSEPKSDHQAALEREIASLLQQHGAAWIAEALFLSRYAGLAVENHSALGAVPSGADFRARRAASTARVVVSSSYEATDRVPLPPPDPKVLAISLRSSRRNGT